MAEKEELQRTYFPNLHFHASDVHYLDKDKRLDRVQMSRKLKHTHTHTHKQFTSAKVCSSQRKL